MAPAASKQSSKEKRYFIAIIPPSPVYDLVCDQKQYFKEHFNSKAALNSPPHITMHMPFQWIEKKEQELTALLLQFTQTCQPVPIKLNGYSSFPPHVIFINVVMSDALKKMQRELQQHCKVRMNLFNANYKELPFHPHITVAFRDLKKSRYQQAWEEYSNKNFEGEFLAERLTLLKHDGSSWHHNAALAFR